MVADKKKYKLVPPDGGYSYVISIATILMLAPTGGFAPCFGMTYNELMVEIGIDTTGIGLINGVNSVTCAIAGFVTSSLLKVMSMRQLAFIAATIYNIGSVSLPFTYSVIPFCIHLSIMQSIGYGFIYNLVFTSLRNYYLKKRFLATSLTQSANAATTMIVPIIVNAATNYYGHRGMLLIIVGISLHVFVGAALLDPVERHLKREEIPQENDTEMKILLSEDKNTEVVETVVLPVVELPESENLPVEDDKKDFAIKKIFKDLFDFKLIKSFIPTYACFGVSLAFALDFIYALIIPRAFYSVGYTQEYVATILSVMAFGDLATRISFIVFSKWLIRIGSKQIHVISVAIAFIARIGMLQSTDKTLTLIFVVIMGFGKCCVTALIPVVLAESIELHMYSAALGILMMVIGFTSLTVGPIIGAIRDYTGSYYLVFWITNMLSIVVISHWAIEKWLISKEKKNPEEIID